MATLMLASAFIFTACVSTESNETSSANDSGEEIDIVEKRKEIKKELDEAVAKADDRIAELEEQAADASEDVKTQLQAAIAGIQKERQKVIDKAREVAEASQDTWKDFDSEAEELVRNTDAKMDSLANKVKSRLSSN